MWLEPVGTLEGGVLESADRDNDVVNFGGCWNLDMGCDRLAFVSVPFLNPLLWSKTRSPLVGNGRRNAVAATKTTHQNYQPPPSQTRRR